MDLGHVLPSTDVANAKLRRNIFNGAHIHARAPAFAN